MAVHQPLAILRVEDLPGVAEAVRFRRRCIAVTAACPRKRLQRRLREAARGGARDAVTAAISAYRASGPPDTRRRLAWADQARGVAMKAIYELYRVGVVSARQFDQVAIAACRLRAALATLRMTTLERRPGWAR
jgi:hypothetical protein